MEDRIVLGKDELIRRSREKISELNSSLKNLQEFAYQFALTNGYEPQMVSARLLREMVGTGSLTTHSAFLKNKRPVFERVTGRTKSKQCEQEYSALAVKDLEIRFRRNLLKRKLEGGDSTSTPEPSPVSAEHLAEAMRKVAQEISERIMADFAEKLKSELQSIKGGLDSMAYFKSLAAEAADRSRSLVERAEARVKEERAKVREVEELNKLLYMQIAHLEEMINKRDSKN